MLSYRSCSVTRLKIQRLQGYEISNYFTYGYNFTNEWRYHSIGCHSWIENLSIWIAFVMFSVKFILPILCILASILEADHWHHHIDYRIVKCFVLIKQMKILDFLVKYNELSIFYLVLFCVQISNENCWSENIIGVYHLGLYEEFYLNWFPLEKAILKKRGHHHIWNERHQFV